MAPQQEKIDILIQAVNEASDVIRQVQKDLGGLGSSAKKAQSGMAKFGKSLQDIGNKVRAAGLEVTVGLSGPMILLGKTMIDQVSNIEQYKVAFDTMLGSAEEGSRVLNEVQKFAAKTPFDLPQVADGARRLLAFGIEADKLLPTFENLGNVAAGTGTDLSRLVLNFGQVATQGKLTGRELRDFAVLGVPLIDELAKTMGVAKSEIQDLVSAGKVGFPIVEQAFANMSGEGGRFEDLMVRQSKTLKGTLSNIKDNFVRVSLAILGVSTEAKNFGEVIEGGPLDRLKTAAEGVLASMENLVTFFQSLSLETQNFIVNTALIVAALGPLLVILGTFIKLAGLAVLGIKAIGTALLFLATNPIGLVLTAIAVLVLAWQKDWFGMRDIVKKAVAAMTKAMQDLADFFEENFGEIIRLALALTKKLRDDWKAFSKVYGKQVAQFFNVIKKLFKFNFGLMFKISSAFFKSTKKLFKLGLGSFSTIMKIFLKLLAMDWSGAWSDIKGVFGNAWGAMVGFVSSAKAKIAGIIDGIVNLAKRAINWLARLVGIAGTADGAMKQVAKSADNAGKKVPTGLTNIFGTVKDISAGLQDVTTDADDAFNALDGGPGGGGGGGGGGTSPFEEAKEQIEALAEELEELNNELDTSRTEFMETFSTIQNSISTGLGQEVVMDTIDSYEDLDEILSDIETTVNDLIDTHRQFINSAQDGLDSFEEDLKSIREEFAALADTISERGAEKASDTLIKGLEDRIKLQEQLVQAQQKGDTKQIASIEAQLQVIDDLEQEFNNLKNEAAGYEQQLISLDDAISKLEEGSTERIALEKQRQDILLDQKVAEDILAAAEKDRLEFEQKTTLSTLEFNRLKTKEALQQNAELEAAAIKAAEEIKRVQEAIVSGKLGELDVDALQTDAAKKLAEQAVFEDQEFRTRLAEQQALLEEAALNEATIFTASKQAIAEAQLQLEAVLIGSYDNIIMKLDQVKQAAEAAFLAQSRVSGGGAFVGGQFATGGYTGGGNIRDVAGVVHKGEWVAPNWMVKSFKPMFAHLEGMRRNKIRGFQEGGEVGGSSITHAPISMTNTVTNEMDFNTIARRIKWILQTN